jgi:opacity protein-like surface antigen
MKKIMACAVFLTFLLPTLGLSDSISVRGGYFIPRANSDLWTTEFDQMTFTKSNFQNTTLGFVYERFLNREISLCIGIEGYTQNKAGSYLDYVGNSFPGEGDFAFPADYEGEFAISHIFNVTITPIQVSLKFAPLGRQSSFIPYVGGGLTLFIWSVRMQGDLIDFTDMWGYDSTTGWVYKEMIEGDLPVYMIKFVDARDETKFSLGYQAFAGIMVPFARRVAFEAELKYNIGKGSLTDFQGFEKFDLSGYQISLGINYWF